MQHWVTLSTIATVFIVGLVSPGPNFIVVTSTAMTSSRRAGLIAATGLAFASLTWTVLSIFGLGILLHKFPGLYAAVKWIGAFYLIWLGVKMLLPKSGKTVEAVAKPATASAAFTKAYFVSLTNPKSAAFFASVFAALIPAHAPGWLYFAVAATAFLLSLGWHGLLAICFSTDAVRSKFVSYERYLNYVFGSFLTLLGARLLVSN